MAAVGNLNEFVKYQMGKGFESGGGAGAAGTAAELAVGFGLAQQMMKDGFAGHAAPTMPSRRSPGHCPPCRRRRGRGARHCPSSSAPPRRRRRSASARPT